MKRVAFCIGLLAVASAASGQNTDFQQLISGKEVPLNLKLKDLNGDWRRLNISSANEQKGMGDSLSQLMQMGMMAGKDNKKNDAASAMLGMSLLGGMFGGGESKAPVYYTKGQTVTIGGETFIVAYRYHKKEINLMQMAMESEKNGGKEPDMSKLSEDNLNPESPLSISLLNVRTISALSDIRPFDMNQEIAEATQGGGLMEMIAQEAAKNKTTEAADETVHARPATPDKSVTSQVTMALLSDKKLSAANEIGVYSKSNTVILKGHVISAAQKTRADKIAQQALQGTGYTLRNQLVVKAGKRP